MQVYVFSLKIHENLEKRPPEQEEEEELPLRCLTWLKHRKYTKREFHLCVTHASWFPKSFQMPLGALAGIRMLLNLASQEGGTRPPPKIGVDMALRNPAAPLR